MLNGTNTTLSSNVQKFSMFKPSSKFVFTDRSKAVLLLWILYVIYVSCLSCFLLFIYFFFADGSKALFLMLIPFVIYVSCLSLLCCLVCYLQPCDPLLGKGRPLGSSVCCASLCARHFPMVFRVRYGS